jgi:hypothetical protein
MNTGDAAPQRRHYVRSGPMNRDVAAAANHKSIRNDDVVQVDEKIGSGRKGNRLIRSERVMGNSYFQLSSRFPVFPDSTSM